MNRNTAKSMKTTETTATAKLLLALAMMLSTSPLLGAATYTYDNLNRLVEVAYDNGAIQTYGYDAGGNRLSMAITTPPGVDTTTTSTISTTSTTVTTVSGTTTTTQVTGPSTVSIDLAQGWNLVGNGTTATFDVGTLFADTSRFVTVWKWVAGQSAWAFYAPSLAVQGGTILADYVSAKGYQLLTAVVGGEGFWVNTKQVTSVAVPSGNPIGIATLGPTLVQGWNLVSLGETSTPKQFCDAQSSGVTTLWAWDATNSVWYFYAPSLDASGGLSTYITSKGYLDFTANNKTLGNGTGFWVNKP
jgi:YD repeat-containing protein